MDYGLIIHGGAWDIPNELVDDHLAGMSKAIEVGYPLLEKGEKALDVVEAVVSYLEDDPTFDAGKGSFLNSIGEIEMDAIVATDDYRIGSVAAVQNIRNPVKVARAVLENNGPIMIVGKGANLFAKQQGFETCNPEELLVGRELERYHELKQRPEFLPKDAFKGKSKGTVGAIALDKKGRLAVAVSTGGIPKKAPGRVGDTPLFGAGAYVAEDKIGVAATGYGEDLIKTLISRKVCDYFEQGFSVLESAHKAINFLSSSVKGLGGVIALGKQGFGISWNTPRMAFGIRISNFDSFVGIEHDDLDSLRKKINLS
ncbi:MAG: isoaspartyl peptidase/L-asparaginase [Candidatus Heimdallarchaeaceae archaeon]